MDRGRLALVVLTGLVLLVVALDRPSEVRGLAPYPPEWQWSLRDGPTSGRFGVAATAAVGLVALLVASASASARARPRQAARILVAAAIALGFVFSFGLLRLEPDGAFATLAARTTSTSWSSYYTVAVSPEAADPRVFLDRHAELLPTLPKHAATHPPGPVLYYRGLIALAESSPRLTSGLLALQGHDEPRDPRPPNTRASKAAALLGALLLTLMGVAAAGPVAAMAARLSGDELAGARVGVLWTLLPGPALFIPQVDQALALPVAAATALLLSAADEARTAARLPKAALAGLAAGIALFASYGAAAFLTIAAVAVLARAGLTQRVVVAGCVGAAVAASLIGVTALMGHDPLGAARTALAIHRETYTRARSYWLWLPFNVLDLALFLGPPVAALFVRRVADSRLARVLAVALALLLLSGATRGEVGRLGIPLMPLLLVAALARPPAAPSRAHALLLAVLLAAIDTALRVRWEL